PTTTPAPRRRRRFCHTPAPRLAAIRRFPTTLGAFPRFPVRMRSKKSRSTSVDIAHRAGVSQATVSRVLRGSPLVNPETRARVLEAVRELNYKVDHRASSLRTQRSGTLAL